MLYLIGAHYGWVLPPVRVDMPLLENEQKRIDRVVKIIAGDMDCECSCMCECECMCVRVWMSVYGCVYGCGVLLV